MRRASIANFNLLSRKSSSLSHVDPVTNRPCMVDITAKSASARVAHAQVTHFDSVEIFKSVKCDANINCGLQQNFA
jgi:hypothetical protein